MRFIHVCFSAYLYDHLCATSLLSQNSTPSSRPPVTGYNISHNITGSVRFNWTNEAFFVLDDVAQGDYFFAIIAVNALGEGEQNNCSIRG